MSSGITREFDIAERIDLLCDAFEGEYRAGRVPLIEDYLPRSHEEDRSSLVVELVLLEVSYRERQGESPDFSDYSRRFPNESEALRRCFPLEPDSADRSFDSTITAPAGATAQIAAPVHLRLGRYELVEPLGTGGFGEVWKARDPVLRRWVAIKTLRSDKEFPPPVVEQFLEEGRKLAQLEHPAIVPVHDVGYARDRCYIVSKLIVGETLEDRVKPDARLSTLEAAEIVAQIADALHHAHLQGQSRLETRQSRREERPVVGQRGRRCAGAARGTGNRASLRNPVATDVPPRGNRGQLYKIGRGVAGAGGKHVPVRQFIGRGT